MQAVAPGFSAQLPGCDHPGELATDHIVAVGHGLGAWVTTWPA